MILRPSIILMDEPLTSLDVIMQLQIKNLIREIHKDHIILFSTHILQLATDLCDEIVILNEGKLSLIDHTLLDDPQFEQRIIDILAGQANHERVQSLVSLNSKSIEKNENSEISREVSEVGDA